MQTEALLISGQILGGNDALEREILFPKRELMTTQHTLACMHARTNANINWWIYAHWHQWVAWQATIIQPQGSISHIRNAQCVQLRRISWFHWIALMNKRGWNGFNVILTYCLWRRTAQQEAQHIYSPISRSHINYIFGGNWAVLSPLWAVHWNVRLYIALVKSVCFEVMMCS